MNMRSARQRLLLKWSNKNSQKQILENVRADKEPDNGCVKCYSTTTVLLILLLLCVMLLLLLVAAKGCDNVDSN